MRTGLNCGKIGSTSAIALVLFSLLFPATAGAVGTLSGTVIESQATMSYKDANNNSFTGSSNTVSATVTSVYAVSVSCAGNQSADSNTSAYYACTVTNTSNTSNTFALAATSPIWSTTLYADDGAGGGLVNNGTHEPGELTVVNSTGALAADATFRFFVATTVPQHTLNGVTSVATLTVTGSWLGGGEDDYSGTMTTTAKAPALTIVKNLRNLSDAGTFGVTANAKPNQTLEYRVQITNNGTVPATEVMLEETLDSHLQYTAGSMRVGPSPVYNGGGNGIKTDDTTGDDNCIVDLCGTANYRGDLKKVTFFVGDGATELIGGTLDPTLELYVFYHVTVK